MKTTKRHALATLLHRQASKLEKKADSFTVDNEGIEAKNPKTQRFVDYLNNKAFELRTRAGELRRSR